MSKVLSRRGGWLCGPLLAALALAVVASPALAQGNADQAADMLLLSARKAYNDKNQGFAVGQFREFLNRFGGHRNASAARYGLALALLESSPPNYQEARDLLQGLTGNKDAPDFARVWASRSWRPPMLGRRKHPSIGTPPISVLKKPAATSQPRRRPSRRRVAMFPLSSRNYPSIWNGQPVPVVITPRCCCAP
jgi:hypothetical protein